MTIDSVIYQLLLSHECVIAPGFGGFIVRESPCTLNAAKDRIKPFTKTVFFNQHLQENDGLLVTEIAKVNNVSYTDAIYLAENWAKNMNNTILAENKASINDLGIFYKGNEDNKWFSPNLNLNLSLKSYGLNSVDIKAIAKEKEFEIQPKEEKIYQPILTIADRAPIEKLDNPKRNWKAWTAAASIALVVHIGYLSIEKYSNNTNQASVIPTTIENTITPTVETPVIIDTIQNLPEMEVIEEPIISNNTPVIEETIATESLPVINNEPAQLIVAGNYRLEQNAINHQMDLAKKGILANVSQNSNNLFAVTIDNSTENRNKFLITK